MSNIECRCPSYALAHAVTHENGRSSYVSAAGRDRAHALGTEWTYERVSCLRIEPHRRLAAQWHIVFHPEFHRGGLKAVAGVLRLCSGSESVSGSGSQSISRRRRLRSRSRKRSAGWPQAAPMMPATQSNFKNYAALVRALGASMLGCIADELLNPGAPRSSDPQIPKRDGS